MDKPKYETHESYGVVNVSRVQCTPPVSLFGSSIKHRNLIKLTISTGEYHRDLSHDWIHGRRELISVKMSPTQFADMITGLNVGFGTPVTINHKGDGRIIEDCPFKSKAEQFRGEFNQDLKDIASRFDSLIELAQSKKVNKSVLDGLKMLKQSIGSNLPFVNDQFAEQMANTVKEAKGEVEAFITGYVQQLGIEAVREQMPLLGQGGE